MCVPFSRERVNSLGLVNCQTHVAFLLIIPRYSLSAVKHERNSVSPLWARVSTPAPCHALPLQGAALEPCCLEERLLLRRAAGIAEQCPGIAGGSPASCLAWFSAPPLAFSCLTSWSRGACAEFQGVVATHSLL